MKIKELLALGIIDDNQRVVIAYFDGKEEEILFKHRSERIKERSKLLEMTIEDMGTTSRYKDCIYISVEREEAR